MAFAQAADTVNDRYNPIDHLQSPMPYNDTGINLLYDSPQMLVGLFSSSFQLLTLGGRPFNEFSNLQARCYKRRSPCRPSFDSVNREISLYGPSDVARPGPAFLLPSFPA